MAPSKGALPPVNFDFGAAQALITRIDDTRRLLQQQKRDRMAQGLSIRQSWKGPYAVRFDGDRTKSDTEAQTILDALASLRSRVQAAIDQAQADQGAVNRHNQSLLPHPSPAPGPAPTPPVH
jgi:uncharacterized protein YukE